MRTTLDLPTELLVEAKKRAVEEHRPLRELIEEGLRLRLSQPRGRPRKRKTVRWVTAPGGVPPGLDLSSRQAMHERLRRGQ